MGFLSPWFLAGLAALGLPIVLHLLKQHKTTPLRFSSLMLFERHTQSAIKRRRLMYVGLLATRLCVLILLALAFANPYISRGKGGAAGVGKKLHILALDDSFSMRAEDRMGQARAQALELLSQLPGADTAQVIAFDSRVHLLTQATGDRAELRAAIQSVHAGDARSSYGELARALRALAQATPLAVEVHLFSDMQRTSLPAAFSELTLASNCRIIHHPIGSARPNFYVESVTAPDRVFDPKQVVIRATLAGGGTQAAAVKTSLWFNGSVKATREASLPASGRATVEFTLGDLNYGFNKGEIRLEASDVLPQDNTMLFSVERLEAARILFVHRQPQAALYFTTAAAATPNSPFAVDATAPDALAGVNLKQYALVVLADVGSLSAEAESRLAQWVKAGGGLWIALGGATRQRIPILSEAIDEIRYFARQAERFTTVSQVDEAHPITQQLGRLDGVKFYQATIIQPRGRRVLARLADGAPLLMEAQLGQGRILLFASSLDNVGNDLPVHAVFVPLVDQAARYLSGYQSGSSMQVVDSFIELRSRPAEGSGVEVIGPDGGRELSLKDAASATTFQFPRSGFFEIRWAKGRRQMVAVNADRAESDLTVTPAETLALWTGGGGATQGVEQQREHRTLLWWYLALAGLLLAFGESVLASGYRAGKTQSAAVLKKEAA